MMGTKVTGKTLGLIGMGRIAQAVAFKAHFGFKMKIIFFDPYFKNNEIIEKFKAESCNSSEELLKKSDFVSLHCPSTKETKGLINYDSLSKMKKTSYLINTARGDIVVEEDLVKALNNKIIKSEDVTCVCTSNVTNMTGMFYENKDYSKDKLIMLKPNLT